ncbi:hypothetical protein [Paenarthrobacter sp. C1]|uniref:hypothetical protein n=1 Tax=Paenarthrobacter sp. C1 TaxID=3400220 RepID=UPI003BF4F5A3
MATAAPKSPSDSKVEPHQLFGYLMAELESRGTITIDAWNAAVDALAGTKRYTA